MPDIASGADKTVAPADYCALFREHYPFVVGLARKYGIEERRVEDVASDILLRLIERDIIGMYRPELTFEHNGRTHTANFRSYLASHVIRYLMGQRDKQGRDNHRYVLNFDLPVVGHQVPFDDPITFGELNSPPTESPEFEVIADMACRDTVEYLRKYLSTVHARSMYDPCDLVVLFDAVVEQISRYGMWEAKELADSMGIGVTAIHQWMWWLRENIAKALSRATPSKRRRILTAP